VIHRSTPAPVHRPAWAVDLTSATSRAPAWQIERFSVPEGHLRHSAVLILFAERSASGAERSVTGTRPGDPGGLLGGVPDLDVLLTERAQTLRAHPGQVSFPGGRLDEDDDGPVAAALREAVEETGLDASGVEVLGTLPEVYLPVSDNGVTPVLAWWRRPTPVRVVDTAEVAAVLRAPVRGLVDPANRFQVRTPSGYVGPAFEASGLVVWGFTALLLDRVLDLAGWNRPWDTGRIQEFLP